MFASIPLGVQTVFASMPVGVQTVFASMPLGVQTVFASMPLGVQTVLASIPLGVQTVLASIPLGVQTETGRRSTGSHQRVVFKYCDSACTLRVRRPRPSSSFTAGFPSSPTPASTARGTVRRLKGPHEMKLLLLLIAFI